MSATLETIAADVQALQKDLKSLRKMVRKVLGDIEDPTGEKKAARAQNNGLNQPNSSHLGISYAVFCLKKKKQTKKPHPQRTKQTSRHEDSQTSRTRLHRV